MYSRMYCLKCTCVLFTDKDEMSHLKKASTAAPDQPSWMELAKKKSQAWSDMPQIIK